MAANKNSGGRLEKASKLTSMVQNQVKPVIGATPRRTASNVGVASPVKPTPQRAAPNGFTSTLSPYVNRPQPTVSVPAKPMPQRAVASPSVAVKPFMTPNKPLRRK